MALDFSYLDGLDVTPESVAEFPIHQVSVNGKTPVLILASATSANKPYYNAFLKNIGSKVRAVRSGVFNANMMDENRTLDRELYPRHVVKGWRDVSDASGRAAPFTLPNCKNFMDQLPDLVFDEVRDFAGNSASHTGTVEIDVAETSKN